MILVAVTLYRETLIPPALYYHVDAVAHCADLGRYVVASLLKAAENFSLKV